MPPAAKLTGARDRANLAARRESTEARLEILRRGYDELITTGEDVGAGDDEGGSEADGSVVERDRLRAQIGEEMNVLEAIEAALARAETRTWQTFQSCGEPIPPPPPTALHTSQMCAS